MDSVSKPELVKVGWVRKRSAYLKQWRERWLVLYSTHLCTYKSEDLSSQPTERIPLTSILELVVQPNDGQHTNTFKVTTPTRIYFMTADNAASSEDWVQAIQSTRHAMVQIPQLLQEKLTESRQNSEMHVFAFFSSLNKLMTERQSELQRDLDSAFDQNLSVARTQMEGLDESARMCEDTFSQFERVYERRDLSSGEKLQILRTIKSESMDFRDFDMIADSSIAVHIPQELPVALLRTHLKVSMENLKEHKVRRTLITRALKWRYNGDRVDALSFSVSKDVLVTAIGVCTPYRPNTVMNVKELKLLHGLTTRSPVLYSHQDPLPVTYDENDSVHKVAFGSPQLLKANSIYTVLLKIDGASSYKCVDCMRAVVSGGDVTWTFMNTTFQPQDQNNRTDIVCGPVADCYYMLAT